MKRQKHSANKEKELSYHQTNFWLLPKSIGHPQAKKKMFKMSCGAEKTSREQKLLCRYQGSWLAHVALSDQQFPQTRELPESQDQGILP